MYKVTVHHTLIKVENYELGDIPQLEKYLSLWDDASFKLIPKGYSYDKETKTLLLPRGISLSYLESVLKCNIEYSYDPDPYDLISVKLKTLPRDDIQRRCISFLIGESEFKWSSKYSQLLLDLQTGDGKTYITVASICLTGYKSMIITHIDRITDQWLDTLTGMTDLSKKEICVIEGSSSINKLMKNNNLKYKVYIVNHRTLQSYAKKYGWNAIGDVFKHLRIGMKVYDEAHLNFDNILRIDLHTNTKKTVYLTATFARSDAGENSLFNKCFRNLARFGSETKEEKRKHIIYIAAFYNSKPTVYDQSYLITNRGFSKIRYSDYLSGCDTFYDALYKMVDHFKTTEGKIVILATKIDTVELIKKFIKKKFPDKTVSSYHSKVEGTEKQFALNADIIVSTPQSSGTGVDIKGLRVVIMTEAYSSKVQADQVSGRLREYAKDKNSMYVELIDIGFKKVYRMYINRLPVFKKKCLKLLNVDLSK